MRRLVEFFPVHSRPVELDLCFSNPGCSVFKGHFQCEKYILLVFCWIQGELNVLVMTVKIFISLNQELKFKLSPRSGPAMAHVVSCSPLTMEAQFHAQVSP
jgi:hypothetical protein